jgi:hypothetical protein
MFDTLVSELTGRGAGLAFGLVAGSAITAVVARWRRHQQRHRVLVGDARDTVVINHHVVETADGPGGRKVPTACRIRTLGQAELRHVIPNGHLAGEFTHRAAAATAHDPLISMDGAAGSYLLETLTGYVCDRLGNGPFDHDLYVMAPCCEPKEMAHHQPVTVLLVAVKDLALFEQWPLVRDVHVEHGSDGCRLLTLMALAQRYRAEHQTLTELRAAGKRTLFAETMYTLDLAIDHRASPLPTKPIPWGRYEGVLKQLGLE